MKNKDESKAEGFFWSREKRVTEVSEFVEAWQTQLM
jgi:hypothetical protein